MGRIKLKDEDKKTKVSVALDPELLNFYRLKYLSSFDEIETKKMLE